MTRAVISTACQVLRRTARGIDDPDVTAVAAPQKVVLVKRRRVARPPAHVRKPTAIGREHRPGKVLKSRQVLRRQRALGHKMSAVHGGIERDRIGSAQSGRST